MSVSNVKSFKLMFINFHNLMLMFPSSYENVISDCSLNVEHFQICKRLKDFYWLSESVKTLRECSISFLFSFCELYLKKLLLNVL